MKQSDILIMVFIGEGRKYLLSSGEDEHDGNTVCEIIKYSEDPHSWFIGDTIQKGKWYIIKTRLQVLGNADQSFLVQQQQLGVFKFGVIDLFTPILNVISLD